VTVFYDESLDLSKVIFTENTNVCDKEVILEWFDTNSPLNPPSALNTHVISVNIVDITNQQAFDCGFLASAAGQSHFTKTTYEIGSGI